MKKILSCLVISGLVVSNSHAGAAKKTDVPAALENVTKIDAPVLSAHSLKIGYIDALSILQQSDEGKQMTQQIQARQEQEVNKLKTEEQKLAQEFADYEKKRATMNDIARSQEEQRLAKKKRDFDSEVQAAQERLKLEASQMLEQASQELVRIAKDMAQDKGLDVVIDIKSGSPLYVSDRANYTQDLMVAANKEYSNKQVLAAKKDTAPKKDTKPTAKA